MNSWFDRYLAGIPGGADLTLSREEAVLLLELAGAAARSAGARQYAPLATFLAGRAMAGGSAGAPAAAGQRLELLRAAVAAAAAAGEGEALGID